MMQNKAEQIGPWNKFPIFGLEFSNQIFNFSSISLMYNRLPDTKNNDIYILQGDRWLWSERALKLKLEDHLDRSGVN